MSRDYSLIEKKIVEEGFFSEYLPPCFKVDSQFFAKEPKKNCDLIKPYVFSMSRYDKNDGRRSIFIPEIGTYCVSMSFIKENEIIKELIEFTENNEKSFSPILGENDTLMRHDQSYDEPSLVDEEEFSDYISTVVKKIVRAAGAKKVLKLDISNCFSSFYTHMIPAIFLGLDEAEENYKKWIKNKTDETIDKKYLKYSKLDELVRRQNLNRTNGLLVGPIFSKIIMEAFLTRIDNELEKNGINFSRYVDDYEVYIYEDEEKQIEGLFVKILHKYGLSLNSEKKEILDFPYYVVENLKEIFQKYANNEDEKLDEYELMNLFNRFFNLEKEGVKGAIRYLLKTLNIQPIIPVNLPLYKAYLLTILANDERSLTKVCSLLIKEFYSSLDRGDVLLIVKMLKNHVERGDDLEVLWLLYTLIRTDNLLLDEEVVESIIKSRNELGQVMLLCLAKDKLTDEDLQYLVKNASSWILLYELYAMDIIEESDFIEKLGINKNLKMYQYLKKKKLHFCQ